MARINIAFADISIDIVIHMPLTPYVVLMRRQYGEKAVAEALKYRRKYASKGTMARYPLRIEERLIALIDAYGVPAGCRSRNEAITRLIERGLAAEKKQASGPSLATNPDASHQ